MVKKIDSEKKKSISVSLTTDKWEKLDKAAKEDKRSRSAFIDIATDFYLQHKNSKIIIEC